MSIRSAVLASSAILFLSAAPMARANPPDSEKITDHQVFMQGCRAALKDSSRVSPQESLQAIECIGYVRGVIDTVGMGKGSNLNSLPICPNGTLTPEKVIQRMVDRSDRNPSGSASVRDSIEVIFALAELWPCGGERKAK